MHQVLPKREWRAPKAKYAWEDNIEMRSGRSGVKSWQMRRKRKNWRKKTYTTNHFQRIPSGTTTSERVSRKKGVEERTSLGSSTENDRVPRRQKRRRPSTTERRMVYIKYARKESGVYQVRPKRGRRTSSTPEKRTTCIKYLRKENGVHQKPSMPGKIISR